MFAKLSALLLCVAFVCALPLNIPNAARDIAVNVVNARGPDTDVSFRTLTDLVYGKRDETDYTGSETENTAPNPELDARAPQTCQNIAPDSGRRDMDGTLDARTPQTCQNIAPDSGKRDMDGTLEARTPQTWHNTAPDVAGRDDASG